MNRIARRLLVALGLFFFGGLSISMDRTSGVEPAEVPGVEQRFLQPGRSSGTRTMGVSSCAASNCHGGGSFLRAGAPSDGTVQTIRGSEYSIWIQQDDHALAYTVLYNDESAQIIRNLKQSPAYQDIRPAYQEQRCLACHGSAPADSHRGASQSFTVQDGVGCEACHGPAEHWLEPHKRPEWQRLTAAEKTEFGFRDTKDLLTRARLCASCHVGTSGRDVNHDLIAAGHPRLNFELSAYQANMPAHWDRNDDRRRHALSGQADEPVTVRSFFEAKLWLLGQVTAAQAALELLEARASQPSVVARSPDHATEATVGLNGLSGDLRSAPVRGQATRAQPEAAPWPEFAEYGCFSCHHDLQADSWRQHSLTPLPSPSGRGAGGEGRRPGAYLWGTWQFPLLTWLSQQTGGPNLAADDGDFLQLRRAMAAPFPDRKAVLEHAAALEQEFSRWAERLNRQEYPEDTLRNLLNGLLTVGPSLTQEHWDAAAQVYLAAVALQQSYTDAQGRIGPRLSQTDKTISENLETIRDRLAFPVEETEHGQRIEYQSPKTFGPDRVEEINEHLRRIQNLVENK